jgi:ATP-dependent Clp protease adapter protein ClpS
MGTRETHLGHRVVKQEERESQTTPTSDTTSDSIGDNSFYEVRLLNDIYTPTPLGIQILQGTFSVSYVAAVNMMLSAETTGACSCGIYRRAAAQILIREVMERARKHHAPLRCVAVPCRGPKAQQFVGEWLGRFDGMLWKAFWPAVDPASG